MFSFIKMQAYNACIFTFIFSLIGILLLMFYKNINNNIISYLYSVVSGVLLSSVIFSLIIPSYEVTNKIIWVIFFIFGYFLIFLIDSIFINNKYKLLLTLALHNIPEGISLGMILLSSSRPIGFIMSLAISNILDGIFSVLSLKKFKLNNKKILLLTIIVALIEPMFCLIFIKSSNDLLLFNNFIISFCSGTMIYTLYSEVIKESSNSKLSSIYFIVSFIIAMIFS